MFALSVPATLVAALPCAQVIGVASQDDVETPRSPEETAQQPAGEDQSAFDPLRRRDRPSGQLTPSKRGPLERIFLEWGGARAKLEEVGFEVEVLYTADGSWAASGGMGEDELLLRGLLDIALDLDMGPALGHEGGQLHAGLQWIEGTDVTARLGVVQPISGIDADRRFQVARIWYGHTFEATSTIVRMGKMDANSQFAYVESGAQFLNSSMGFSPTIYLMPSYPETAFGATLTQHFGAFGVHVGAFDGALASGSRTGAKGPEALFDSTNENFFIGEVDAHWGSGRVAAGGWASTATVARFDGGAEEGTGGFYATAEQRLGPADASGELGEGGFSGFLQLGLSDGAVTAVEDHVGAGIAWTARDSPIDARAGFGVSRAGLSKDPAAGFTADAETVFELYYGFEPLEWMRVTPDVQYYVDPGGDAARDDAWILTLRFTLSI